MTHVHRRESHRETAWRNGGGTTREVALAPAGSGDGFAWRVSFAEVSRSGPVSAYPGVDRVITLVTGKGLELTVDGVRHALAAHEPFAFSGDADTHGTVASPSVDFNVMARRGQREVAASVSRLSADDRRVVPLRAGEEVLVACFAGTVLVQAGAETVELHPFDVLHETSETLTLAGPGVAQVTTLHQTCTECMNDHAKDELD